MEITITIKLGPIKVTLKSPIAMNLTEPTHFPIFKKGEGFDKRDFLEKKIPTPEGRLRIVMKTEL